MRCFSVCCYLFVVTAMAFSFFFQAEDGIRARDVTGVQTCALPIWLAAESDRFGGKPELALQEYTDFLNQFGDSPMADTAQFQIGLLHFQAKDMAGAAKDFEALAQKY